jgi:quaternary ammonium compound-resistance protein SugE
MPWIKLIIVGQFEIGWAIGLNYTNGFSRFWPTVVTFGCMSASFWLLMQALKSIPMGTCYAVWTGIGAAGTAIVGMAFLGESHEVLRILSLFVIIFGIVALKLSSPSAS